MKRILVVYASEQGQTEKIAQFIGNHIRSSGHRAEVFNVTVMSPDPGTFDGVIVGAPVHVSGYPAALRTWVQTHASSLNKLSSVFFSVCLGVLQHEEKVELEEKRIVNDFMEETGWRPRHWELFAGALMYSKYNWLLKRVMRKIARKAGADTDMSMDYEYTDWSAVRRFTEAFLFNLGDESITGLSDRANGRVDRNARIPEDLTQ